MLIDNLIMWKNLIQLAACICTGVVSLTAMAVDTPLPTYPHSHPVRIAIIMDDLGYNRHTAERALQLPGAITYAVIPFTPHAKDIALEAHQHQREVLLHMPMESNDPDRRLDDGGLRMEQNETQVRERIDAAIRAVPYASGMNNHMGSQITADSRIMNWVMDEVRQTPLFFIDSMTNPESVARSTALRYKIPSIKRDVFLDNRADYASIDTAFNKLVTIARHNGYAVAIGHPHSTTIAYLEQKLPQLDELGIELVPVSRLTALYGQPVDRPIRLKELMQWIVAMPEPTSERLNFAN